MGMAVIVGLINSTIVSLARSLMPVTAVCEIIDDFGVWITPKTARFLIPRGPADEAAGQA